MKVALLVTALAVTASAAETTRTIEGQAPVADLARLVLEADVGSIELRAVEADAIRWRVELEPNRRGGWRLFGPSDRRVREALEAASIASERHGEALVLELEVPSRVDRDDLEEHWSVELPSRLAARLALDVGELRVDGTSGDLRVEVDVGDIALDVRGGAIDARIDVGDIELRSSSRTVGPIDLASDVGGVDLELDGRRIKSGGGYGPGAELRLDGAGRERIRARADVGSIDVRIDGR